MWVERDALQLADFPLSRGEGSPQRRSLAQKMGFVAQAPRLSKLPMQARRLHHKSVLDAASFPLIPTLSLRGRG